MPPILGIDVKNLFTLLQDVQKGEIRIPYFQREIAWYYHQRRDLLDSIRRQYPIGSIVVWDTDEFHESWVWVGSINVPGRPSSGTTYVLDGHQRLATLAGVLLRKDEIPEDYPDDPGQWEIYFDLEKQDFVYLGAGERKPRHFPMWKFLDTFAYLEECKRLMSEFGFDRARTYIERAQVLSETFKNYKLPVVRVSNSQPHDVMNIVARLNPRK